MCRTLLVADSGSGVSAVLDPAKFLFVNVDLTVVLTRDPAGEWLHLDSVSTIGDQGTGLAETVLSDASRPVRPGAADPAGRTPLNPGRRAARGQVG